MGAKSYHRYPPGFQVPGPSFYSSTRGSKEPRLEAHPGYGATEIRNQEIRSRSGAAPLPAYSPEDARGEKQQTYCRSGIAQEKVHIHFLDAEDGFNKSLELKMQLLLDTMKLAATKNMKATVNDLLVKVRKSRYQRYRVFCNARQEREARKKRKQMAKLRKALTKPEDWQRHMRVLERLAAPKIAARPKKRKPGKKKKWRPVNMERIHFLALPMIRVEPKFKEPFKVTEHALTYRITKRMERLAVRKKQPEILYRTPGAVSPAAMKATASERIITLAKPAQRPAGRETDLREDAFTVSPMALKARCSKRLKILAKPKTYPEFVFKRLRTARKR